MYGIVSYMNGWILWVFNGFHVGKPKYTISCHTWYGSKDPY